MAASFLWLAPVTAAMPPLPPVAPAQPVPIAGNTGDILPPEAGQSRLVQDPLWLAAKASGRTRRGVDGRLTVAPNTIGTVAASYPSSFNLDQSISPRIVEPEGSGWDDQHRGFTDANYWNMCSAGAAAAAISYFKPGNVTAWPAGTFTELSGPYRASTYWKSSDTGGPADTGNGYSTVGRAYTMYIAEQVRPPSYPRSGGLVRFDFYPTHGGSITDQRDAINWEISGHSPYWQNYFYAYHSTSGLTAATFKQAVQTTLVDGRAPLVLAVNTYATSGSDHLPNWNRRVAHSITLIGYSDLTKTYRYVDTCGRNCGSLSNGGTHDVSQTTLFNLLVNVGIGFLY